MEILCALEFHNKTNTISILLNMSRKLILFILATLLLVSNCNALEHKDSQVIQLEKAKFQLLNSEEPPSSGDWETVILPNAWSKSMYERGDNGWYQFDIHLTELPNSNWGIYLPHLNMNAAVFLNGVLLGDGGQFTEPIARNWNHPLYFHTSPEHWRIGENIISVRLKSYPGYGHLSPLQVGPEDILQSRYRTHVFFQNDINAVLMIGTLFAGIFIFSIWLSRRNDVLYLWYSLMAFCWALFTSNTFITNIPVSVRIWDWLIYSCIAWWTVLLAIFSHRAAEIHRPKLENIFLIWAVLSTIAYAFTDLKFISQTALIWQVGSIIIGFVVSFELLLDKRKIFQTRLLGFLIALVLLTGIHDWLMQSGLIQRWWVYGNHILHYAAPLLIMYIGWTLIGRFISAIRESEELNITLEHRIAAAQGELQKNFAQTRKLEINQAAMLERERIYRDLHDDVGAKLLGLAISAQRSNLTREADVARSALQDLRDVVSRSAYVDSLLGDLIADLRAETEQRISPTGLRLEWSFPHEEVDIRVGSEAALNLSRILRESVTNVLRHADASSICIAMRITNEHFSLEIEDDGKGCVIQEIKQHRGMLSMQTRAAALNASLAWSPAIPKGCRVSLHVPLSSLPPLNTGVT